MEQTILEERQSAPIKKILLIVGLVAIIGWAAIMAINLQTPESTDLFGGKAANFTLSLFDQYGGEDVVLADLRGQVVVVNFWASWCVECYKEAGLLEQASRDYRDKDVVFLGVAHLDTEKEALAYLAQYGITYPNGPDIGDKISQQYHITGVPETFFIDKDGNISHVQIGPIEKTPLYHLLDRLVAQSAKGT